MTSNIETKPRNSVSIDINLHFFKNFASFTFISSKTILFFCIIKIIIYILKKVYWFRLFVNRIVCRWLFCYLGTLLFMIYISHGQIAARETHIKFSCLWQISKRETAARGLNWDLSCLWLRCWLANFLGRFSKLYKVNEHMLWSTKIVLCNDCKWKL